MTGFTLHRIHSPLDWLRVHHLYHRAFPHYERKPFAVIRRMRRAGKTDVWVLRQNGHFAGLAITINGDNLILIDYLAVSEKARGQGVGSAALHALADSYPGCGLFVEIESPFEPGDDQPVRQRRRAFYERCGFAPARTMVSLFGVAMELMCRGFRLSFEEYHHFYCTHYSQWAGQHIKPLPHPEA